jgi:glycosyltransferase involved in cell wall biosynthesis
MSDHIKMCLSIASISPQAGGTSRSVLALADTLQDNLIVPFLITPAKSFSKYESDQYVKHKKEANPFIKNKVIRFLRINQIALVHDNGIWHPFNHMISRVCRKLIIPRMVSPHGMLEPWSLQYKKWKKRIAWKLYQYKDLKTAVCFHATASREAENIRKLGFSQPIAVIPMGVHFPDSMPRKQQVHQGVKSALFLSRIHPKKGLKDLVSAWNKINPENWNLFIAGPDEGGHEKEIKALVKKLGLSSKIHFLGHLSDTDKWHVYRSSDLFILPTYSENFGIVVAEALAAEIPVITTTETPWRMLEEEKCGWWIPPGEAPLVSALNQVLQLSGQELHAMGQRGREMVLKRYDWKLVARLMSDVYRWILHKGPKPECVIE